MVWRGTGYVRACVPSRSVMSDSLQPRGLWPARFFCPWDFPGKNTGVGCHFLLQGIFPTQESKPSLLCLLHWQADSLPLSHLRSPRTWVLTNRTAADAPGPGVGTPLLHVGEQKPACGRGLLGRGGDHSLWLQLTVFSSGNGVGYNFPD